MKAGWAVKPLEELTTKIGSGATPRGGKNAYKAEGLSLIRSLNIHDLEFRMKDLAKIDDKQADALSNVVVEPHDVLLNITGASIARCSQVPEDVLPARVNQHVAILRPRPEMVASRFLAYLLVSKEMKDRLLGIGDKAGSTRQALTKSQLQSFCIPVPPLEEQQRIVGVLDEAFEDLARARAHAEANLQNARELFSSVLDSVFSKSPMHWTRSNLGKTCTFVGGSQPPKSEFVYSPGEDLVRLIQIRDYKSDKNIVYIPQASARRFCEEDDVMIGRYGPPLFQILRGIRGAYNVALMKAIPNPGLMSKDFLYYFLQNGQIFKYINDASSRAAGQIGLNKATLEPYPISYPKKDEQREVVQRLDAAKIQCDNAIERYETKFQDLDDLRQSLLQKAFAGELT